MNYAIINLLGSNKFNFKTLKNKLKKGAFGIIILNKNNYHRQVSNLEKEGFLIKDMISVYLGDNNQIKHLLLTLFQKPREDTYCHNAKEYNCGGLHIDACRVSYNPNIKDPAYNPLYRKENGYKCQSGTDEGSNSYRLKKKNQEYNVNSDGRFPANLILIHNQSCQYKGKEKLKNPNGSVKKDYGVKESVNCYGDYEKVGFFNKYGDKNGEELVEDWNCVNNCPIKLIDYQSGKLKGCQPHKIKSNKEKYEGWGSITKKDNELVGFNDSGGASRYFNNLNWKQGNIDGLPYQLWKWLQNLLKLPQNKEEQNAEKDKK